MNATDWLQRLQQERAIAVIRALDVPTGLAMAQAMYDGGLRLVEITWGSRDPDRLVQELRDRWPDAVIGAGTIRDMAQFEQARRSGAEFIFAPGTDAAIIQAAIAAQLPVIPGALTPTEILTAWQLGATCVKVFPITAVGEANYLRSLRVPLSGIPLIPTGGINFDNAASMIEAGAIAVAMAGDLFPAAAIAQGDWDTVRSQAALLVDRLSSYRQHEPFPSRDADTLANTKD
jgi:2-dehydro-3-deoxyphosphogluconate aldolase / (4S)-4-hydroxy-2-oxoglutarate aldolase